MHVDIKASKDRENYFTVTPFGPIDSDTYTEFNEKITPLLNESTQGIILDLANVDYISSAGLGVLFTTRKFLKENNGDLLFCNIKPQIRRLFEIVKALPKEILFENPEEADAYLYRMMQKEMEKDKNSSGQ